VETGLQNKVALVTGASRGLGQAIAAALAAEGCQLIIVARGQEALESTAAQLRQTGAHILAISADVTVAQEVEHMVKESLTYYGSIDILVHNVGGARGQDLFDTSDEAWQEGASSPSPLSLAARQVGAWPITRSKLPRSA